MGTSNKYRLCEMFIKRIKILPKIIRDIEGCINKLKLNLNCPINDVLLLLNKKIDLIIEHNNKLNFLKKHFTVQEIKIILYKYVYNIDTDKISSKLNISKREIYRLLNKFDARVTGSYYEFI